MICRRRRPHQSTAALFRSLLRRAFYIGAAFQAVLGISAPEGGVVAAGSATLSTSGDDTLINQSTGSAIINWDRFGIAAGEQVQFVQPDAQSWVLNRDLSGATSQIHGRLSANGRVFLQNAAGVLIGTDGSVDVGAFVATTADIVNSDFMAGDFRFSGAGDAGAAVTNLGTIEVDSGGVVALIGGQVSNAGVIRASAGKVALAAAETFTLDFDGDGLLSFAADSVLQQAGGVDQSGEVTGGTVLLTARTAEQVLDNVVNLSGVVRAVGVSGAGGRVVLHAGASGISRVSGTVDASGSLGGEVDVLGHKVVVEGTGLVDASGAGGGGRVRIGGGFQGNDPEVQNAEVTGLGPDAEVRAGASTAGDGGRVIVWSDGVTRFYGSIDASGAGVAGTGGFVEVSGKLALDFRGQVDIAGAADGGTLLLDPTNITLVSSGDGTDNNSVGTDYSLLSADAPTNAVLDAGFIVADGAYVRLQASDTLLVEGRFSVGAQSLTLLLEAQTLSLASGAAIELQNDSYLLLFPYILMRADAASTLSAGGITVYADGNGTVFPDISLASPVFAQVLEINGGHAGVDSGTLLPVLAANPANAIDEFWLAGTKLFGEVTVYNSQNLTLRTRGDSNNTPGMPLGVEKLFLSVAGNVVHAKGGVDSDPDLFASGINLKDRLRTQAKHLSIAATGNVDWRGDENSQVPGFTTLWLDVSGAASLASQGGIDAVVGVTLATAVVGGTLELDVQGGHALSQSGALTAAGLHLSTKASGAVLAHVVLAHTDNRLGELSLAVEGNATIASGGSGAVNLAGAWVSGALDLRVQDRSLIQSAGVSAAAVHLRAAAVTLTHADNRFASLGLTVSGDASVAPDSSGAGLSAMTLADTSVGGRLELDVQGILTQRAPVTIVQAGITALGITLTDADNRLAYTGASNDIARAMTLAGFDATGSTIAGAGSAVLVSKGELPMPNMVGLHRNAALTLSSTAEDRPDWINTGRAGRTIFQAVSGAITSRIERLELRATGGLVSLGEVDNTLTGGFLHVFADDLYVATEHSVLELGELSLAGSATIETGGAVVDVTQTDAWVVTETLSIDTSGTVQLTNPDNRILRDAPYFFVIDALDSTLADGGTVLLSRERLVHLASTEVTLMPYGTVTQSGAVTWNGVDGFGALVAPLGAQLNLSEAYLQLDHPENNLDTIRLLAKNAYLVHSGSLTLGALQITDDLTVNASGDIQQSGSLRVGRLSLSSPGAVVLETASNEIDLVEVQADSAMLANVSSLTLGATSVTGLLQILVAADLSQSGALRAERLSLSSAGAVVLEGVSNDMGVVAVHAQSATLVDTNTITLDGNTSVADSLTVSVDGDVRQSGALTLGDISLSSAGAVVLHDASNDMTGLVAVRAQTATLVDSNALTLGSTSVTDSLLIVVGGPLSQSGAVVAGQLSLSSAGAVVLNQAENLFNPLLVKATSATLVTDGAFTLGSHLSVADALTVSAGGDISQSGAFTPFRAAVAEQRSQSGAGSGRQPVAGAYIWRRRMPVW